MKVIDTTMFGPVVIGGVKETWLFECNRCGYNAIFVTWKGAGLSTGCELCRGDMERIGKVTIWEFGMQEVMKNGKKGEVRIFPTLDKLIEAMKASLGDPNVKYVLIAMAKDGKEFKLKTKERSFMDGFDQIDEALEGEEK